MGKYFFSFFLNSIFILIRSEGSLNQHIKLKHPEYYLILAANNPNLQCLSKKESSFNDGRSINSGDSNRDKEDNIMSDESEDDDNNKSQKL